MSYCELHHTSCARRDLYYFVMLSDLFWVGAWSITFTISWNKLPTFFICYNITYQLLLQVKAACVLIDLCSSVLAPWMTHVIAKVNPKNIHILVGLTGYMLVHTCPWILSVSPNHFSGWHLLQVDLVVELLEDLLGIIQVSFFFPQISIKLEKKFIKWSFFLIRIDLQIMDDLGSGRKQSIALTILPLH